MFDTAPFADASTLVQGLVAGLVFGFLLQRGSVGRYETVVGQFLLRDHTMLRVMLSAIVVGGLAVYGLDALGLVPALHVKAADFAAIGLGGGIFAIGMVLLGYCPGTGLVAVAEGARDARYGLLGMLAGAGLFAEVAATLRAALAELLGDTAGLGKATLPSLTGLSPFVFLVPLAAAVVGLFAWLRRRERGAEPT
jgi:hypothetical protein